MFAWAHPEHGLGMHVYIPAQRDAPTNMINNAFAVAAAHKLRFAQDLILYNLELTDEIDGFEGDAHKATWQEDPIWQATRENVERLTGIRDWAEAFFATPSSSSRWSASCSAAASSCRPRRCTATTSRRR